MTPGVATAVSPCFVRGALSPVAPGPAWALYLLTEGSGQTVGDSSGNGRDLHLGMNSNVGSDDPAWTTFNGVACLEGAGSQICVAKTASTLAQPWGVAVIGRCTGASTGSMFVHEFPAPPDIGLTHMLGSKRLRLMVNSALPNGIITNNVWFAGIGIANWTPSYVGIYGGHITDGLAGNAPITHHTLMGRFDGTSVVTGWVGQIAAAVVVASPVNVTIMNAWVVYLAAMKGITL